MKVRTVTLLPVMLLALSGCASSLSGVGGAGHYACHAPEGAQCTSVSGVYANSIHGTQPRHAPSETQHLHKAPASMAAAEQSSTEADAELRSKPRLLRVWIAPWEDSDGDLHEANSVHMLVDSGHWLIEHVRPAPRTQRDAAIPPATDAADGAGVKPGSATPSAVRGIDRLPPAPATAASGDATSLAR